MQIEISARPPFSLQQVINAHGWPQLAPFQWDRSTGDLARVERLRSGKVVALAFHAAPGGVRVAVSDSLSNAEREEVAAKAAWMLALDQDLSDFYREARGEPKLAHVEPEGRGRLLRSATLFEDTVKTILTTNTAWSGTIRMVEALN